jgi:hypothetical protein
VVEKMDRKRHAAAPDQEALISVRIARHRGCSMSDLVSVIAYRDAEESEGVGQEVEVPNC